MISLIMPRKMENHFKLMSAQQIHHQAAEFLNII